jgi:hypothetical protein
VDHVSLSEENDDRLLGELAALADGSLRGARRARLEARAAGDPALAGALDEQRRAVGLIRAAAAEVEAPAALRERILREAACASVRRRTRWVPGVAFAGVGGALLAAVIALSGGPTAGDAAAFAARPPSGAAPRADGRLLGVREAGLAFPAWDGAFGWRATGTRSGEVEGRDATTVYYEKDAKTLAYTIVSGEALDAPDDARTFTVRDTQVALFDAGGRRVATWKRNGRTCMLIGDGVPDAKLAELAAWRAA